MSYTPTRNLTVPHWQGCKLYQAHTYTRFLMGTIRHGHLCIGRVMYSTVTTVRMVRHTLFMVTGSNHSHIVAQTQRVSAPSTAICMQI